MLSPSTYRRAKSEMMRRICKMDIYDQLIGIGDKFVAINISYKLLKAFLALAEQRNFTRAAEHSHVSQSTFSGMIRRIEEEVGARLFDRTTRSVVLTSEGELFAEAARHLTHDIQWTFSDLQDYV